MVAIGIPLTYWITKRYIPAQKAKKHSKLVKELINNRTNNLARQNELNIEKQVLLDNRIENVRIAQKVEHLKKEKHTNIPKVISTNSNELVNKKPLHHLFLNKMKICKKSKKRVNQKV